MVSFDQFLSLISALAELKEPKRYRRDPRKSLLALINNHLAPLLIEIESKQGVKRFGMNSLYS